MSTHSNHDGLTLPVSIIIGSIIIGCSVIFSASRGAPAQKAQVALQEPAAVVAAPVQQPAPPEKAADIKAVKTAEQKIIGNASAPVTVAYWYDYNCGYCKAADEQVIASVMADYVKTGKIRLVFKDLQFLTPDSTKLGIAARAVWEVSPSKFYDWHKLMFENQGNLALSTNEKLLALTAQALGKANADKVISLVSTKTAAYQAILDADKAEGASFGIRSTPSFIVGDQLMVGLRSYADIKAAIDSSLKK